MSELGDPAALRRHAGLGAADESVTAAIGADLEAGCQATLWEH